MRHNYKFKKSHCRLRQFLCCYSLFNTTTQFFNTRQISFFLLATNQCCTRLLENICLANSSMHLIVIPCMLDRWMQTTYLQENIKKQKRTKQSKSKTARTMLCKPQLTLMIKMHPLSISYIHYYCAINLSSISECFMMVHTKPSKILIQLPWSSGVHTPAHCKNQKALQILNKERWQLCFHLSTLSILWLLWLYS